MAWYCFAIDINGHSNVVINEPTRLFDFALTSDCFKMYSTEGIRHQGLVIRDVNDSTIL